MIGLRYSFIAQNTVNSFLCRQNVCTSCTRFLFWEPDFKGGYNTDQPKVSYLQHIKNGWKNLKEELKLFKHECIEKFESDPILNFVPGVVDKKWELRSEESLSKWVKTCDSDHGEGFSTCSLTINKQGYGVFSGVLDTTVPKDGKIKRAGYCSIRTVRPRISFQRNTFHDWSQYTHLVLRVRGDGRSYMINIATSGYFDQLWNDMFQYVLYTRGGPYWQVTKIPFSKFFFSNKGRIQDLQSPIMLDKITNLGFVAADKINGPFSLEIDYIGCEFDPAHTEEFAYEKYLITSNIAAT